MKLDSSYFSDGANYRVAVGAVPAGARSTEACVGWCERLFNVPEHMDDAEAFFTGVVYELSSVAEASAANALMEQGIAVTADTMLAATNSVVLRTNEKAGIHVLAYHYDKDKTEWTFVQSGVTDANGNYVLKNSDGKKEFISGETYKFLFEADGYEMAIKDVQDTAQPGKNTIMNVYCYLTEYSKEFAAMRKLTDFDVKNKKPGLFAEYFTWTDKNDIFTSSNKRYEGYVPIIEMSWSGETVKPSGRISYYRLNEYSFDSDRKGTSREQINYVPFKFGARFNGYVKLKGANGDAMAAYKFRVRGDDGVRLKLEFPSTKECFQKADWRNGSSQEAIVDLSDFGFYNGTVLGVTIEYYNKSNGGKANLIFEYSVDGGKNWITVPTEWLYAGERTVSVFGGKTGVDYVGKLAESKKTLENYSDELIANMLGDLAGMAINSGTKLYNMSSKTGVISGSVTSTTGEKITQYIAQKTGKKVAKAFYKAVFNEICELNDEKTIWAAICEELKEQFKLDFTTVFDATETTIDSIGTVQEIFALMQENAKSNANLEAFANAVLRQYTSILKDEFGNYTYDSSAQTEAADGAMGVFFEISSTEREEVESSIIAMDPNLKAIFNLLKQSSKILDTCYGTDDANTNRAMLYLMYAESSTTPRLFNAYKEDLYKASLQQHVGSSNVGSEAFDAFFGGAVGYANGTTYINTLTDFERVINGMSNKTVNSVSGWIQGIDIGNLLYRDLLKATLDATYSYYKGFLK